MKEEKTNKWWVVLVDKSSGIMSGSIVIDELMHWRSHKADEIYICGNFPTEHVEDLTQCLRESEDPKLFWVNQDPAALPEFTHTDRVLFSVSAERGRQDDRWGGPDHDDSHGIPFFIQLAQDYASTARVEYGKRNAEELRKKLIQVASIAVAAVERLDREIDQNEKERPGP